MFEVSPDDIKGFDGQKLVELLRRLLYAEAEAAGVPLYNVAAPLQITIADGGEDASVAWTGGAPHTDYFAHRDVVFQCKASDPGNAGWKKETWTKDSQKGKRARILNPAVTGALTRGAVYAGVTATPLVKEKAQDRMSGIEAGIVEAGGDPTQLHSVGMYDGNRLAAWASRHRAVALWVKEQRAGMPLAAFLSLEQWGKRPAMLAPPFAIGESARFEIGDEAGGGLTFEQFSTRLVRELNEGEIRSIRVTGASGLGKSRGVFEAVRRDAGPQKYLMEAMTVFCDFREVSGSLWNAANQFATHGTPLVLVIDECPRDDAKRLHQIAAAAGSRLRVVTIDTDYRSLEVEDVLAVKLHAADNDVIAPMLLHLFPKATVEERSAIHDLCAGFPRIAVLAARGAGDHGVAFSSETDAARSILKGANLIDEPDLRALGALALFDRVGINRPPETMEVVAEHLARMSGDEMYDRLITALKAEMVGRYGDDLSAQPRPIANYLAGERLERLRPSTIVRFLSDAPEGLRRSMLGRVPHLRRSSTLKAVASDLLGYTGVYDKPAKLLTPEGARLTQAFVYVSPDLVSGAIHRALQNTSIDHLTTIQHDLDGVRAALQSLAANRETFPESMRDLLRLSAAEAGQKGGPASEMVEQLFHLRLSGTAASSRTRYAVLDEVMKAGDPRLLWACSHALQGGIEVDHFMRVDYNSALGDAPPQADWAPSNGADIITHLSSALNRLSQLRSHGDQLAERAEQIVASRMRRLIWPELIAPLKTFIDAVKGDRGFWPEAAKGIGDWLYFDRPNQDDAFGQEVRRLYDEVFPTEPEDRAVVFSQFWQADLRDPDRVYGPDAADKDFDWAARQAAALAPEVAADPERLRRVVSAMASRSLNSPTPFTEALAPLTSDPVALLTEAVSVLDKQGDAGRGFVLALLHSLEKEHPLLSEALAAVANKSTVLSRRAISVFAALSLTPERLIDIAKGVREGTITPDETVPLSFGRSMDGLPIEALAPLLDALIEGPKMGGVWSAIEILSMFLHNREIASAEEAIEVKRALLAPLGDEASARTMSGHGYGVLIGRLKTAQQLDETFAAAFAATVVAFAQTPTSAYESSAREALQKALKIVMSVQPDAVWRPIAGFYEVATPAERDRLGRVIFKRRDYGEGTDAFEPALLFMTPITPLVAWATEAPDQRISFLVSIFPILERRADDQIGWHPDFDTLVGLFGGNAAFAHALRWRIFPRSWSGSIEGYLEPYQGPLTEWNHPHPLAHWAEQTLLEIDRRLTAAW